MVLFRGPDIRSQEYVTLARAQHNGLRSISAFNGLFAISRLQLLDQQVTQEISVVCQPAQTKRNLLGTLLAIGIKPGCAYLLEALLKR